MATEPKQKSASLPPHLGRILPAWITPLWLEADRWRSVVRNQPVAIICRNKLITYLQALPWDVRARDSKDSEALQDDIRYYKKHVLRDLDVKLDMMWQDALDLPIGGSAELTRWEPGALPKVKIDGEQIGPTRPSPLGHVNEIVPVDGATLAPTFDQTFPMMQRIKENMAAPIFFKKQEMARVLLQPRPELMTRGYGMPPPQTVFLAISLLFRGDQYYANLLLETPEAGVLDLLDMERSSAEEWVESYRDMMHGIDPFKIGVLYEHTTAAKWIPFGRPPTEMMFDTTTKKYARITASAYWLTLSDIGMDDKGGSLGEAVRRQRETRSTGFGMIREKTRNLINDQVLPPYLEFAFIEQDDEAMTNMGRARLTNAQALKAMKEGGFISEEAGLEQLKKDGLLTVEIEKPPEPEKAPPAAPPAPNEANDPQANEMADNEAKKVPVGQGGRGDIGVQKADTEAGAIPANAPAMDMLGGVMEKAFESVADRMGQAQLRKLVKAAARLQFPTTSKALVEMSDSMRVEWAQERAKRWWGQPSIFDGVELIERADNDIKEALRAILADDTWWQLSDALADELGPAYVEAYGQGATVAASEVAQLLYEEGLIPSPDMALDFELSNPETLELLSDSAAELVRNINEGTETYLRSAITSGVDAGLSSDEIALQIQEGQGLEDVLKDTNLLDEVADVVKSEIKKMFKGRVKSIVNTEIAMAETEGRRGQWKNIGLTKKGWKHTGSDTPCPICQANIDMGMIGIDEEFESVFGSTQGPPAHPQVDHCHLIFDEKELIDLAGNSDNFKLWDGS